jgi:phosphatidylethanolamine-binding protein (PEBP) family uncharacterized protein
MEPRKGADGLIAPLAEVASARVLLALALAVASIFAGCGGDSGSEGDSAQAGSPAQAARKAPLPGGAGQAGAGSAGAKSGAQEAGGTQSADRGGNSTSQKQGPSIATPEGAPEQGLTSEQRETAKVASITLESPALLPVAGAPGELPSNYTCDGKDSWPALRWRGVPEGTAELVLFAMGLEPLEGKLFFNWALAGLDPELEGLEAARLPKSAVMGQNGYGRRGYSICPSQGDGETYFFVLYALPERLSPRQGFDPRALRKEVQELSRNVGILPLTYARAG